MNRSPELAIDRIAEAIQKHHRFVVATHVRPDGDAIGSLLAMTLILRRMGKEAVPHCQDPVPDAEMFLPAVEDIRHEAPRPDSFEVALVVDCGEFNRVGPELAEAIGRIPLIVNIDHHVSNAPFGQIPWVDQKASSTCELLYALSHRLGVEPDPEIATCLYTGLLTDTGSFRFSNTNRRTLEIATELVAAGAQPADIAQQVYSSTSAERLFLLARVLSTVQLHRNGELATAELTLAMLEETGSAQADSEGFIDLLRSVKSVTVAAIFRETPDGLIHVSLRSKGNADVASFARSHGGGGHRNAAAFRTDGPLARVKADIVEALKAYLK